MLKPRIKNTCSVKRKKKALWKYKEVTEDLSYEIIKNINVASSLIDQAWLLHGALSILLLLQKLSYIIIEIDLRQETRKIIVT